MGDLKKLLACLNTLDFHPKVDDFQDKLIIQKTTCLLELLGLEFGYPFSIYIRGPYSPDLTRELYENREMVEKLQTNYSVEKREREKLSRLAQASDNLNPTMLEIMATYSFLTKSCEVESKEALVKLKRLKPFYSEAQIAVGVSRVKQLFFVPTEKEIKEMKTEFDEWDNASNLSIG